MQKTTTLSCKFFYVSSYDNCFYIFSFFSYTYSSLTRNVFLRTNKSKFKSRFTVCVNNAMASNQKTASIKTLRKWEKEFQLKLDFARALLHSVF